MSRVVRKRIFRPAHEKPGKFWLDYILLPYGQFYDKTKGFLKAKSGDTLRFFNGPDVEIESATLIDTGSMCDFLCKMRYGITWDVAFRKWLSYARMEGNGKDILSKDKCILVILKSDDDKKQI